MEEGSHESQFSVKSGVARVVSYFIPYMVESISQPSEVGDQSHESTKGLKPSLAIPPTLRLV